MLGWLFRRRPVFRFWDGQRRRVVDPFDIVVMATRADALVRAVVADFVAATDTSARLDATEELVMLFRGVFDVKPMEEGGLLATEVLTLAAKFARFAQRHFPGPLADLKGLTTTAASVEAG